MRTETFDRLTPLESDRYARRLRMAALVILAAFAALMLAMRACSPNRPRDYANDLDHYYYGSIGSDISGGLPVKLLQVLPTIFPDYLPKGSTARDYSAFGFIQQPGRPLPIGFSIRRQIVDRAALNCASCHTGQVQVTPGQPPVIIPGMPANTVDLLAYFQFLFRCAADDNRFNAATIVSAMKAAGIAGPLDGPLYGFIVPVVKDAVLAQQRKNRFVESPSFTAFGPGRVDTFDTFKFDQFGYYYRAHAQTIPQDELYGIVDFPSVWNQGRRDGLPLHWDGNNSSLRERNFSAAIGSGARPEDVDLPRLFRVEAWLKSLPPPQYPFPVNAAMAARGKPVYERLCASCHDFGGSQMGKVIPLAAIGTDRSRLDSYTPFLRQAQIDYTSVVPWKFSHFTNTAGYVTLPLDGIWARAPYLHNGSVPTMWDLLSPSGVRPKAFTLGEVAYDAADMGFRHENLARAAGGGFVSDAGRPYTGTAFVLDTGRRANSNAGHEGPAYGTTLSDEDKRALIEFLKTQ